MNRIIVVFENSFGYHPAIQVEERSLRSHRPSRKKSFPGGYTMNESPPHEEDSKPVYDAPALTELGNVAELTGYTVSVHV
jgi:hypothetical protein